MDSEEFPLHTIADLLKSKEATEEHMDAVNRIRGAHADLLTTLHEIQELEGSSLRPQNETIATMASMARTMLVRYTPCPEARKKYEERN